MSNTNDDTNMTGNADNCDPLRTKSGQGVSGTVHASIAFRSRDEAITALCQKVFGASPVFPDPLPSPTIPANCRNALRDAGKVYPKSGCAVCGDAALLGCPYEETPPAERPTPITDAVREMWLMTPNVELGDGRPIHGNVVDVEFARKLERDLAESNKQRDAAHQKCREYRLVALGAEDALEKMTAQRDEAKAEMWKARNALKRVTGALRYITNDFRAFKHYARTKNNLGGSYGIYSIDRAKRAMSDVRKLIATWGKGGDA